MNRSRIIEDFLRRAGENAETPAYFFDSKLLEKRVKKVKNMLGSAIPLTFSIKANPFLLNCLPEEIAHVEVCSPGELEICENMQIPPRNIIYSGVMKEETDIRKAAQYGVEIMTAESVRHADLENAVAADFGKQKVILRLTSGNQFGMSKEDISYLIAHREAYRNLEFIGLHFYSGTQKKKQKQIAKDLEQLAECLEALKEAYDFVPQLVEYGPGLAVDYFEEPYEEQDDAYLAETVELLIEFAQKYPLGIEMGRYFAAPCGTYVTQVKDVKYSFDTNYVICDGGMHHLKYYGQTMAMQVPPIRVMCAKDGEKDQKAYCICGSLCTVADVLVRETVLPELTVGDLLAFGRCGAYSVTEGSALFLSRMMPRIYLILPTGEVKLLRDFVPSDRLNIASCK